MDSFFRVAEGSQEVRELIDEYYKSNDIEGFSLGIHNNYVTFFRQEFGAEASINDILDSEKRPTAWREACIESGFTETLSPIYIVIYVSISPEEFRTAYSGIPRTVGNDNYYLLIEYRHPYSAQHDRTRHRPNLMGGISISNEFLNISGTLGGFMTEKNSGEHYLSSCNHVLCHPSGCDIIQPGRRDSGVAPGDIVAYQSHEITLVSPIGFTYSHPFNCVDVALAKMTNPAIVTQSSLRMIGRVAGAAAKSTIGLGDDVVFVGKESDLTEARVYRFILRLKVTIFGVVHNFGEVFELEPRTTIYVGSLSRKGDSGSWVIRYMESEEKELLGILFAGNGSYSICCFIETVISKLDALKKGRFEIV